MGRVDRSQLSQSSLLVSQALLQCAESCEQALRRYVSRPCLPTENDLFRELVPAIATVRTAVDLLDDQGSRRELALSLAQDACRRAALACRRYRLDAQLLLCAALCDRTAGEIELFLISLVHE
jgi:hypothetical protein